MLARHPAGQRAGADHGVLPDQAVRGPGGRGPGHPRLRGRGGPWRSGPGPAGTGHAGVPQRQDRRAGRHRRRPPRAGRRRCHPRDQLRVPGRRQGLPAPHRPHRPGRRSGVAVTFVDWRDMPRWKLINETLGLGIPEPPETYSTSEHLFEALDIPAGVERQPAPRRAGAAGLEAEEIEDIGETGKARSPRRPARPQDQGPGTDQGRGRPGSASGPGPGCRCAAPTRPSPVSPAPMGRLEAKPGRAAASQGARGQGRRIRG